MSYTEQNDKLFEYFLENTFFKAWKTDEYEEGSHLQNYKAIELMVTPDCPLSCKYCYFARFGDGLFPPGSRNREKALRNAEMIIEWLYDNGFRPHIEMFSGDTLVDVTSRKVLHRILDSVLSGKNVTREIVAPTNMTWLLHPKQREDVELLIAKAEAATVPMWLSASVDGKYMEENRPFKSKKKGYTDEFYHDMFSFATRTTTGFHPMVYSEGIENWIKNFDWWQDKFKEYNIPWHNLYLLEVRNANWNLEQTKHLGEFVRYLVRWLWDKANHNSKVFWEILQNRHDFNIVTNWYSIVGRGLGCSLQSTLCVRLGDATIVPCHRTSYKGMETAIFKIENDKVVGLDTKNLELYFAAQQCNAEIQPYCEACDLAPLCAGGCLGSQYESTGDLFTPIPTVCRMEHMKVYSLIDEFDKIGQLSHVYNRANKVYQHAIEVIHELGKKGE